MIVRLVLAVVVAAALLGAAVPVVEDARHDLATTTADRSVQTLADAVEDLHRSSDPVPRGVPGATRVVEVEVPADGTITVGAATTDPAIDGPSGDVIAYRVSPNATGRESVDVDVRSVENGRVSPDDALEIRETGRVVLRYVLVDGEPTVTVASL